MPDRKTFTNVFSVCVDTFFICGFAKYLHFHRSIKTIAQLFTHSNILIHKYIVVDSRTKRQRGLIMPKDIKPPPTCTCTLIWQNAYTWATVYLRKRQILNNALNNCFSITVCFEAWVFSTSPPASQPSHLFSILVPNQSPLLPFTKCKQQGAI